MDALDEMKEKWSGKRGSSPAYSSPDLLDVIRKRTRQHTLESMKYFWASFTYQIIVYALYGHVLVKYFHDPMVIIISSLGIVAYLPFTHMLMRKFKQLALNKPDGSDVSPVFNFVEHKRKVLQSFFRFKRRYELFLVPVSTLFGTLLVFQIYVPGGPFANLNGVWITIAITLIACFVAIRKENAKGFHTPLAELDKLLTEFNEDR